MSNSEGNSFDEEKEGKYRVEHSGTAARAAASCSTAPTAKPF
jgi:hypothetical protein